MSCAFGRIFGMGLRYLFVTLFKVDITFGILDFRRKMKVFGQENRLMKLTFTLFISDLILGCIYSSELNIAYQLNNIERSISLTFEPLNKAIHIDTKVCPHPLMKRRTGKLEKEWLFLYLVNRG